MSGLLMVLAAIAVSGRVSAQAPARSSLRLVAATANLEAGPDVVRIDILKWSSDTVRSQLLDAWNLIPPAPGAGRGGRGTPAAGGRGATGARGTRGGGPPTAGGRGTRGAGLAPAATGPANGNASPDTPKGALAAALQSLETVGYIWTTESTGYSLRYAYRLDQPDGGARIILATDRRLGAWDGSWKSTTGPASDDPFTILELRLNGSGQGEGKASLGGTVGIDNAASTIALDGYATLPVSLRDIKPRIQP